MKQIWTIRANVTNPAFVLKGIELSGSSPDVASALPTATDHLKKGARFAADHLAITCFSVVPDYDQIISGHDYE